MFVLLTFIPRFKIFIFVIYFPIIVSIFEMLVLNAKEIHIELF